MHGVIPAQHAERADWLKYVGQRATLLASATLIGATAVWYSSYWLAEGRFIQSTDDAYVGGEVTTIASKVGGFVQAVSVSDNQEVKAGDLLVKLDDRDYRALLERAESTV